MKTIKTLVKIIVIFLVTVTNANAITDDFSLALTYYYIGGDRVKVNKNLSGSNPALVNNWGDTIWVGQAFTEVIDTKIKSESRLPNEGHRVTCNHPGIENLKITLTFESWAENCVEPFYNELTGKYSGVKERPLDIYLIGGDTKIGLIDKPEDECFVETVMDTYDWREHKVDITTLMLNFINNGKTSPRIVFGGAPAGGKVKSVSIKYTYTINPDYKKASAVNEVMSINANNDVYYDLSGKMITTPVKGRMYIKNGKLAIFK